MIGVVDGPVRAERFSLALGVRYRSPGKRPWTDAVSVNVSRTGLLFMTNKTVPAPGDRIDFLIHLPAPEGATGCDARCTGRVVRVVPCAADGDGSAVGVTIDRYVLIRESGALRPPETKVADEG